MSHPHPVMAATESQRGLNGVARDSITDADDVYELTPLQEGMLFHTILSPNASPYSVLGLYTIRGELNAHAFERAWQSVLDRHTALRTSFHNEGLDRPLQVVHRHVAIPIVRHNLSDLDEAEKAVRLGALITEHS